MFQFYLSSIKSPNIPRARRKANMFQFYLSSIKRKKLMGVCPGAE